MRINLLVCIALFWSPLWAGWDAVGPFGGSAAVIQVDRYHRGTLLAATSNAQLFRSFDSGDSWRAVPFPAELRATLHAFVLDPQNPGIFLAGLSSDNPAFSGILRSADNGLTWKRLSDTGLKDVWSIAVWPKDSRVLAAGTQEGVFLTHDGGQTWTPVTPPDNPEIKPVVSLAFDPKDSKILYAGTPHLPWKTVDGGVTWNSIHTGMLDDSDVFSIHVDRKDGQRVFASACSGIYRSADAGGAWKKLTGARSASYRTYQITQDAVRPNILFAGTTLGLTKSVDGGTTWHKLSDRSTRWIAFDPYRAGRIYVATEEGGLFRSDNFGESLRPINRGFSNHRLGSLAAAGKILYVNPIQNSAGGAILRRPASGQTWSEVPSLETLVQKQVVKIVPVNSRSLYIVTVNGLVVTTDAGKSWQAIPPPPTSSRLTDLLVPASDGHRLLVGTEEGVFQTDDAGQTWTPAQLPQVKFGTQVPLTSPSLLLSSAGVEYQTTKHPGNFDIYGIVATEHNGFLAATSRGIMRASEESGMTWKPVAGILGNSTVAAICQDPARTGVIFASQYGVIFGSKDEGRSWTRLTSEDNATESITELLVAPEIPERIFALTRGRGVYAIPLAELESRAPLAAPVKAGK